MPHPWLDPLPVSVPAALAAALGGHPLVAETLVRRGISDPAAAAAFLDPDAYTATPPAELPGLTRAVTRLGRAIRAREPICVWGDFDVDGQTATALLVSTLADLGAVVTYHVPLRETEGHGISVPHLKQVIAGGTRVILTCDTGSAAVEAVAYARTQRVDVIITDHHELPPVLPAATALINPHLLAEADPPHPLAHLPGVGVAYKLAEALYAWARRPAEVEKHLDLVALGIVADVAVQLGDTRYLLQRGLAALRRGERLGLRMMLETAQVAAAGLTEEHIGFVIGPRLNAAGRLADAAAGVALLTTADEARARILAADLEALNGRRKQLCDQVEQAAHDQIARDPSLLEPAALVLAGPGWPAGIVGIVASRLVERYGKPTILIATGGEGPGRASARSVAGVDITAALAVHAELLLGYGGHAMAAGFTIDPQLIAALRRGLDRTVAGQRLDAGQPDALRIDARLPLDELSLPLIDDLARLAPFGPGNPPLILLAEGVMVKASRIIGRDKAHRLLQVAHPGGPDHAVVRWEGGGETPPEGLLDLAYMARASSYRGTREVQVEWIAGAVKGEAEAGVKVEVEVKVQVEVVDCRTVSDPATKLTEILAPGGEAVIWREGEATGGVAGHDRLSLPAGETLIIWTSPPGPAELRAALARVRPRRVILFANAAGAEQAPAFLRRLAGVVKHALRTRAGRISLAELAAATAQTQTAAQAGLDWLAAGGHIHVGAQARGALTLVPVTDALPDASAQRASLARVAAALAETAAYRAFYRETDSRFLAALIP